MNAVLKGSCLVGMGMFVVLSRRPARAAEGPLLVVVEAPPALDADAAEIRRAIGTELRSQTIAPMKRGGEPPERALIVAFDRDRIAMSLRTNDGAPIVRDIPAPADPTARLRAIAWLAGNLARDQVTPLVAEAPIDMTPLATIPAIAPPPAPSRHRCHHRRDPNCRCSDSVGHANRRRNCRDNGENRSSRKPDRTRSLVDHFRGRSDRQYRQV